MGLLRKAAAAGAREPAIASPAAEPAREGRHAGAGLLRKTLGFLASPRPFRALTPQISPARGLETPVRPAAAQRPQTAAGRRRDCAAGPGRLRRAFDGVELPSRLFTSLKRNLSIVKGALLLYDPVRLEYAPWASCGFDETTLHRLRISLGANETFNALANGKPLSVTDQGLRNAFQTYFSSREFASVGAGVLLCPFIVDDTLAGVLLVTELKAEFENDDQLLASPPGWRKRPPLSSQKARGRLMKKGSGARPSVSARRLPRSRFPAARTSPAARGKRFLFCLRQPVGVQRTHPLIPRRPRAFPPFRGHTVFPGLVPG